MPSSTVELIDYENAHSRLTVAFVGGSVYEYYLVPPSIATLFRAAASKGTFFNRFILGTYVCRNITPASSETAPRRNPSDRGTASPRSSSRR